MKSVLEWILNTGDFMSHGHCYLWNPGLLRLHIISDLLIGVSYAVISLTLLYLVRKARGNIPFHWMFLAFGGFIIACGCTHFMEIWTIWTPAYWLSGWVKAITAAASVTTALVLPRLVPKSLLLIEAAKTSDDRRLELEHANLALRTEVSERERAEASVRQLNSVLEERVASRTAQLAEANQQLAQTADIVHHSNDAIYSVALDGTIVSWNAAAERIYGYTAAEILGQTTAILLPEDRKTELRSVRDKLASAELPASFETVRVRRDGSEIDVHLSVSPIRDSAGALRGGSVIARDITERKRAEQQYRETQKLESLGLIAGGVAHDFNNLLVGIMGNAGLVLDNLSPGDENRELLECVVLASEKAADLTRRLLAYAGKGKFISEKINLSLLVRQIESLVRASVPKTVEMRLNLSDRSPMIEGDPSQIQQLVMNLMINAAEAIGDEHSGVVSVTTTTVSLGTEQIRQYYEERPMAGSKSATPGKYVSLAVQDTGCGMDAETLAKIFDPFFTTKFTGRGLGLAAVLGIVGGHRGMIRVQSQPGSGTTFTVMLPSIESPPPADARPAVSKIMAQGAVLVVDDESVVRSLARAALERAGYTVLTAENGSVGVDLFRERCDEIVVVLLDLTMPVMSGQEAFRKIQDLRPGTRVIVSSGYSHEEAVRRFEGAGVAAFIQKPYTVMNLVKLVKEVASSDTVI